MEGWTNDREAQGGFKSETDLGTKGVAYLYGAPCTRILYGFAVLTIEVYVFLVTTLSIEVLCIFFSVQRMIHKI